MKKFVAALLFCFSFSFSSTDTNTEAYIDDLSPEDQKVLFQEIYRQYSEKIYNKTQFNVDLANKIQEYNEQIIKKMSTVEYVRFKIKTLKKEDNFKENKDVYTIYNLYPYISYFIDLENKNIIESLTDEDEDRLMEGDLIQVYFYQLLDKFMILSHSDNFTLLVDLTKLTKEEEQYTLTLELLNDIIVESKNQYNKGQQ